METQKDIQEKVQKAFSSLESIEETKISPFFKDKTMNRLFAEKKVSQPKFWFWLTPQVQLVMLITFIVLNAFAFMNVKSNTYDENVNQFAESYGLSIESDFSTLN